VARQRAICALRTVFKTVLYRVTGARWLACDAIYQSLPRLSRWCRRFGLRITRLTLAPRFFGMVFFVYLRVVAADTPPSTSQTEQRAA
jgi:hypothetical protein